MAIQISIRILKGGPFMLQVVKQIKQRIFPITKQEFAKHCTDITTGFQVSEKKIENLQNQVNNIQQSLNEFSKVVADISSELSRNTTEALLDQISEKLISVDRNLTEYSQQTQIFFESLSSDTHTQLKELHEIKVANATPTIWYNSDFERLFFKDSFGKNYKDTMDFEQDFLSLISGLDLESIRTVIRVLNRQKKLYEQDKKFLNIFTLEEQGILRDINQNFYGNIFEVSKSLYCYNGYFLPRNHFEVIVFYYGYFLESFQTITKIKAKNIIDAGGFIGDSALLFSRYTDKKVYSFEAVPEFYNDMKKTICLNHLANVVPENKALSSKAEILNFQLRGNCSTTNEHIHEGLDYTDKIQVEAISLDEYVEKNHIEVGLIKVDIEGSEQDFIKGALKTIKSQKPALIFSIYHNADDFFHIKTILENLDLGYRFWIRQPQIGKAILETLLFAEVIEA